MCWCTELCPRGQVEELSDEFMVVAWDAPGCGSSSDPPASFRLAEYADAWPHS